MVKERRARIPTEAGIRRDFLAENTGSSTSTCNDNGYHSILCVSKAALRVSSSYTWPAGVIGVVVALLPSGRIDCETGGDDVLMLNLSKVNNSSCRWKFSSCCAVCAHYYSAVQQYLGTVVPQYMYEGYESRNTTPAYLVHPYIPGTRIKLLYQL